MFEKVQQWRERRTMKRLAADLAAAHKGYAAKVWPLTPAMAATERAQLADEARTWLARQLSGTATPYGITLYIVGLGFVEMQGDQRTPLDKESLTIRERIEAPAIFDQAATLISGAELPAAMTHVEVYLFSAGDIIKHTMPTDERGAP